MSRFSLSFVSLVCLFAIGLSGCGGKPTPSNQELGLEGDINDQVEEVDYSTFTLYLKEKVEFVSDSNITTNYEYDSDGYLLKIRENNNQIDDTTIFDYKYFEGHKVLKVYEDDVLAKLATFVPRGGDLDYNVATSVRLSIVSQKQYLYHAFDTVSYHGEQQINSIVSDIEFGQNIVNLFSYDSNGFLTKMQSGSYDLSSDIQSQLSSETNTSFLLQNDATILPFTVSETQNYLYSGNILKTIQFDIDDDGDIDASNDVNISYHPSGDIKSISMSVGGSWEYNTDGILISTKTASGVSRVYTYSNDYKTVTVTGANGAVVKQYIFDELKGN